MNRFKKVALSFLAIGAAAISIAQVDTSRTVVVINGQEVKGAEYYRSMEFMEGVGKAVGGTVVEMPPGLLTLDKIITDHLILELAKEKGVYPNDAEVKAELDYRYKDKDYMKAWNDAGRTEAELMYATRITLAKFKLQTRGINITDAEITNFYNTNPGRYTLAKRVRLRAIMVRDPAKKDAIDKKLASGADFGAVAREDSEELSRLADGDMGFISLPALNEVIRNEIAKIKVGSLTSWINASNGTFAIFKLEQVQEEKKLPLDADLKRSIRNEMMLQSGSKKNEIAKEMAAMRAKAKIDIKDPFFAKAYSAYIKQYLTESGFGAPASGN